MSRLRARQYARSHLQQQQSAPNESMSADDQCLSLPSVMLGVFTVCMPVLNMSSDMEPILVLNFELNGVEHEVERCCNFQNVIS
jgi:hypothetical protein